MQIRVNRYNSDIGEYETKLFDVIGKVKYIGQSFGVDSLTNEKIYNVLGVEDEFIRIVDDSGQDYLYLAIEPVAWSDPSKGGRFEVVEDSMDGRIKEAVEGS